MNDGIMQIEFLCIPNIRGNTEFTRLDGSTGITDWLGRLYIAENFIFIDFLSTRSARLKIEIAVATATRKLSKVRKRKWKFFRKKKL